jgi:beta-glucosidase
VNGIPTSESRYLLTEMLRDEWGFDGLVVSDWYFSVKSTAASVNAGLDLEMPAPEWRGEKLLEAVQRGEVAEATIDTSVRRLLHVLVKAGVFAHPELAPEQTVDLPEPRALVREAGAEGIVLPTPLDRGASISDRLTRCVARSALPLGIRYSLRVRRDERWQHDRQSSFKT